MVMPVCRWPKTNILKYEKFQSNYVVSGKQVSPPLFILIKKVSLSYIHENLPS